MILENSENKLYFLDVSEIVKNGQIISFGKWILGTILSIWLRFSKLESQSHITHWKIIWIYLMICFQAIESRKRSN